MKLRHLDCRDWEVRAILDGRKTQTRRILTVPWKGRVRTLPYEPWYLDEDGRLMVDCDEDGYREASECLPCPYGVPGDELWVRETGWLYRSSELTMFAYGDGSTRCLLDGGRTHDEPPKVVNGKPWRASDCHIWKKKPSILMPKWASRLTLVVRSVRVERLSAVTDADARAEGARELPLQEGEPGAWWQLGDGPHARTPRLAYIAAFRAMHKLAAAADPWLWVVTFDRKEPT